MPKKKHPQKYTSVPQQGFSIRSVATLVITTAVSTAVVTLIGGFFAFARLSSSAVTTTFANAAELTALRGELEEGYLPRVEFEISEANRDKRDEELREFLDTRFNDLFRLLEK